MAASNENSPLVEPFCSIDLAVRMKLSRSRFPYLSGKSVIGVQKKEKKPKAKVFICSKTSTVSQRQSAADIYLPWRMWARARQLTSALLWLSKLLRRIAFLLSPNPSPLFLCKIPTSLRLPLSAGCSLLRFTHPEGRRQSRAGDLLPAGPLQPPVGGLPERYVTSSAAWNNSSPKCTYLTWDFVVILRKFSDCLPLWHCLNKRSALRSCLITALSAYQRYYSLQSDYWKVRRNSHTPA